MKWIRYIPCLLLLLLVTACAAEENTTEQENGKKVTVMLDWFPNTNHTGLYVAQKQGFFQQQGLEVEIVPPAQGGNTGQLVASNKVDFGVGYQEGITQARAQDIPLVSIGAVIQHNTSAFASLKKAGIEQVKDFEGKTYGGWGDPSEKAVLEAVLKQNGADASQVKQVTLGQTDFFKSIGKLADIEWIYYGWDGVQAELQGIELNYAWLKDLHPALDYYTPVIMTSESKITQDPETVRQFMQAVAQGYQFAIQNPEKAADILLESAPELNKELVHASQKWLADQYQADAKQWGWQKKEVWTRYTQFMVENGLISKTIDVDQAFTNQFLPKEE